MMQSPRFAMERSITRGLRGFGDPQLLGSRLTGEVDFVDRHLDGNRVYQARGPVVRS